MTGTQALGTLAAYLIGGIPFGLLAGLTKGVDVRKSGSGNIGAANVMRVVGVKLGLAVFVLDLLKGLGAVLIGRALGMEGWMLPTIGLIAVMGHSFSPYLALKGGKGVATGLGVITGLHPLAAVICLTTGFAVMVVTRYVSLGSVLGVVLAPALIYFVAPSHNAEMAMALVPMCLLIISRHNENIERLLKGTENRIGSKRQAAAQGTEALPEEPTTPDE